MKVIIHGKHDSRWRATVICQRRDVHGCGATLEIERKDIFLHQQIVNRRVCEVTVCCFCQSCGAMVDVENPLQHRFGPLPTMEAWRRDHPEDAQTASDAAKARDNVLGIRRGYTSY